MYIHITIFLATKNSMERRERSWISGFLSTISMNMKMNLYLLSTTSS